MLKLIRIVLMPVFLLTLVCADECPALYRRFHKHHSSCLPRKKSCRFVRTGIEDPYHTPQLIVRLHNELRSKTAMGQERRAGGMPQAADMLEYTWDEELAYIAQKWVEQCYYEHECWECRLSTGFVCGQCLAEIPYYCVGIVRGGTDECQVEKENWTHPIRGFHDEVDVFDKRLVKSMVFNKAYGHFVEVNWATTYRVGCGFAIWRVPNTFIANRYYACNYAPAADTAGGRMYIEGPPCSQCPINSCCGGATCRKGVGYLGLCHLYNYPPLYLPPKQPLRFHCTFMSGDPSCFYSTRKWQYVQYMSGNVLSVVANGGESPSIRFHQYLKLRSGSCLIVYYKKGANVHGDPAESRLEAILDVNGEKQKQMMPTQNFYIFKMAQIHLVYDGYAMLELKFVVPPGYPPQYMEINEIKITPQRCGVPDCVCQK